MLTKSLQSFHSYAQPSIKAVFEALMSFYLQKLATVARIDFLSSFFCLKTLVLKWKSHVHVHGSLHFITLARTDFNVHTNSHSLHTLTKVNPTD